MARYILVALIWVGVLSQADEDACLGAACDTTPVSAVDGTVNVDR